MFSLIGYFAKVFEYNGDDMIINGQNEGPTAFLKISFVKIC